MVGWMFINSWMDVYNINGWMDGFKWLDECS